MNIISAALLDIAHAMAYGPPSGTADIRDDEIEARQAANVAGKNAGQTRRRLTGRLTTSLHSWLPGMF